MYPSVFAAFHSTLGNEGDTNWMYLDNSEPEGLVHSGTGNLLEPVSAALDPRLAWFRPDGVRATDAEVVANWNRVKAMQDKKGGGGMAFKNYPGNDLRLSWGNVEPFVQARAKEMAADIEQQVPLVKMLPADAQLGILRWAWAMGSPEVVSKAQKMWTAIRAVPPDFDKAGAESDWIGQNLATKLVLTRLFQNATDATQQNLPAETLLWKGITGRSIPRASGVAQGAAGAASGGSGLGSVLGMVLGAGAVFLAWNVVMEKKRGLVSKGGPAVGSSDSDSDGDT